MDFGAGTYAFGFVAGVLSTLSPCVLPLLPILLATAAARHRFGAIALSCGLALSFAATGLLLATIGASIGLDADRLRRFGAVLLVAFGAVMCSAPLQRRFAAATAAIGAAGGTLTARIGGEGWTGQFALGLLLGILWTPCVGPTLGAASTVAAQGTQLGHVALLMLLFGFGAGTPLMAFGGLSREVALRWRGRLLAAGGAGRSFVGAALLVLGAAILTGLDHRIEAYAVEHSPDWLTSLTTRY